ARGADQLTSFGCAGHSEPVVGKSAEIAKGIILAGTVAPNGVLTDRNGKNDVIELIHTCKVGESALFLVARSNHNVMRFNPHCLAVSLRIVVQRLTIAVESLIFLAARQGLIAAYTDLTAHLARFLLHVFVYFPRFFMRIVDVAGNRLHMCRCLRG